MSRSVIEYRCLIISPSDVAEERAAIVDVVQRWNASVGVNRGIRIEPVRWETHAHPDLSGPPQAKVNEQIVDDCDFGIAVFWSRVGTPTTEYGSGSVEEIERLTTHGAKVMVYQSSRPIPPDKLDTEQFNQLKNLSEQYRQRGLLGQFGSVAELREMVNKDLSLLLGKEGLVRAVVPELEIETAKRPDIRVNTWAAMVNENGEVKPVLVIKVENHSPRQFYLSSVSLKLLSEERLIFTQDSVTRTPNAPKTIESGDSHSLCLFPSVFASEAQNIVCAEANDKIGRVFNSDAEQTRRAVQAVMKERGNRGR